MARKKSNPHLFTSETARQCKLIAQQNRRDRILSFEQEGDVTNVPEQPKAYSLRSTAVVPPTVEETTLRPSSNLDKVKPTEYIPIIPARPQRKGAGSAKNNSTKRFLKQQQQQLQLQHQQQIQLQLSQQHQEMLQQQQAAIGGGGDIITYTAITPTSPVLQQPQQQPQQQQQLLGGPVVGMPQPNHYHIDNNVLNTIPQQPHSQARSLLPQLSKVPKAPKARKAPKPVGRPPSAKTKSRLMKEAALLQQQKLLEQQQQQSQLPSTSSSTGSCSPHSSFDVNQVGASFSQQQYPFQQELHYNNVQQLSIQPQQPDQSLYQQQQQQQHNGHFIPQNNDISDSPLPYTNNHHHQVHSKQSSNPSNTSSIMSPNAALHSTSATPGQLSGPSSPLTKTGMVPHTVNNVVFQQQSFVQQNPQNAMQQPQQKTQPQSMLPQSTSPLAKMVQPTTGSMSGMSMMTNGMSTASQGLGMSMLSQQLAISKQSLPSQQIQSSALGLQTNGLVQPMMNNNGLIVPKQQQQSQQPLLTSTGTNIIIPKPVTTTLLPLQHQQLQLQRPTNPTQPFNQLQSTTLAHTPSPLGNGNSLNPGIDNTMLKAQQLQYQQQQFQHNNKTLAPPSQFLQQQPQHQRGQMVGINNPNVPSPPSQQQQMHLLPPQHLPQQQQQQQQHQPLMMQQNGYYMANNNHNNNGYQPMQQQQSQQYNTIPQQSHLTNPGHNMMYQKQLQGQSQMRYQQQHQIHSQQQPQQQHQIHSHQQSQQQQQFAMMQQQLNPPSSLR